MRQRRQKRMESNRESARRSRMRKQMQLEELTAEVGRLQRDKSQLVSVLCVTTQQCTAVETENAVLRAQVAELTAALESLEQILLNVTGGACSGIVEYSIPVPGILGNFYSIEAMRTANQQQQREAAA